MSPPVAASKVRSEKRKWWKILNRDHTRRSLFWKKETKNSRYDEQKMPRALPGSSGGKLQGRSKDEKGKEEADEEEANQGIKIRSEVTRGIVAGV